MAVSGTGQGETPQSLVTPAFAGFHPIAENGTKAALTTGMTTDRKIFDFLPRRGIMAEIEYPGVAQLVGRDIWDVEVGCSSHLTRTKIPLKSLISEGFFFVYCGAGGEPVILNIFFVQFRLVVVIFAVLYYNKCGNIGEGAWYERKQIPKMVADYSIFFTSLFPYTIRCFCLNNFKLVSQFFIRLFQKDFGVILIALNHPDLFSVDIQRD